MGGDTAISNKYDLEEEIHKKERAGKRKENEELVSGRKGKRDMQKLENQVENKTKYKHNKK